MYKVLFAWIVVIVFVVGGLIALGLWVGFGDLLLALALIAGLGLVIWALITLADRYI